MGRKKPSTKISMSPVQDNPANSPELNEAIRNFFTCSNLRRKNELKARIELEAKERDLSLTPAKHFVHSHRNHVDLGRDKDKVVNYPPVAVTPSPGVVMKPNDRGDTICPKEVQGQDHDPEESPVRDSDLTAELVKLQAKLEESQAHNTNTVSTIRNKLQERHTHDLETLRKSLKEQFISELASRTESLNESHDLAITGLKQDLEESCANNRALGQQLSASNAKEQTYARQLRESQLETSRLTQTLKQALYDRSVLVGHWADKCGPVQVMLRIKPESPNSTNPTSTVSPLWFRVLNRHTVEATIPAAPKLNSPTSDPAATKKIFEFDRIFPPDVSEDDVFDELQPVFRVAIEKSCNTVLVMHGYTGSGKSHTMRGLLMRIDRLLGFQSQGENSDGPGARSPSSPPTSNNAGSIYSPIIVTGNAHVTVIEIYGEEVRDLLAPTSSRATPVKLPRYAGMGIPTGCTKVPVTSASELQSLVHTAELRRTVSSTGMNTASSRSHMFITLHLDDAGSLTFADLAGAERHTEAGTAVGESSGINKAVGSFQNLVRALSTGPGLGQESVPVRDTPVTKVLGAALGFQSGKPSAREWAAAKLVLFATIYADRSKIQSAVDTMDFAAKGLVQRKTAEKGNRMRDDKSKAAEGQGRQKEKITM